MKVIEHELNLNMNCPEALFHLTEDTLLFDIETTGFSAKTSQLYLIGTAVLKEDVLHITQYLAQSREDEAFLLIAFFNLCKQNSSCITYNGLGFDIPYLEEKAKQLKVTETLSALKKIDIYKELKPYKHILKLMDLKQKSVEQFLGIEREDLYTGGELISHYMNYSKTGSPEEENLLLLHNYEDILGMAYLLPVLSYLAAFRGEYAFESASCTTSVDYYGNEENRLVIEAVLHTPVPQPVSYRHADYYLSLRRNKLYLSAAIKDGQIKVPYLNYKDFVYLKNEDMAVLKELAKYVDKNAKTAATLETAYGKFQVTEEALCKETLLPYIQTVLQFLSLLK